MARPLCRRAAAIGVSAVLNGLDRHKPAGSQMRPCARMGGDGDALTDNRSNCHT